MLYATLRRLYSQEEVLIESGQFGSGLWPIDPPLGHFLQSLICLYDLKRGLEVGAGVGYSTAWLTAAFQETSGTLVSLEYFPPKVDQLELHMGQLFGDEYDKTLSIVPSDINRWRRHAGLKRFDFVFFDQRKGDYLKHLRLLLPLLKKGAFICADNVTSHADACEAYLEFVRTSSNFSSVTLDIGAGLELSRYL